MPTIAVLKEAFQNVIAPGDDVEFLRTVFEADSRLSEGGLYSFTKEVYETAPADGYVTLPTKYFAILGATMANYPLDIRSMEFEYVPGGAGQIEIGGGESNFLVDQGLDEDGARFYKVTGQIKADYTLRLLVKKSPVILYDPDIADSNVPDDATNVTMCPDIGALKNACLGVVMENASDPDKSNKYFGIAYKILDNREKSQRGQARQQFNIRPMGPYIRGIATFR